MSDYEHWLVEQQAHTATLTLNRPDEQNNLTPETLYELRDITAYLRDRKDVWAVIVQGQGKSFSIGLDVNMIHGRLDSPEQANREFLLGLQGCLDEFEALEKPTIAKLHGFCLGGGLILALCCDFRVASQRTVFGLPEARLGIGVIMGTQRVTRVAGVAATKEIILLGKRFSASAARAYGLVHQVVALQDLDAAVTRWQTSLARSRRAPWGFPNGSSTKATTCRCGRVRTWRSMPKWRHYTVPTCEKRWGAFWRTAWPSSPESDAGPYREGFSPMGGGG